MSSQIVRIIVLCGVCLFLGVVVWHQFFRVDPSLQEYQVPGLAPPAPAPSPVPAAAPAGPSAPETQSQFREVTVDIDELLQGVQEIGFDYELERLARNPMTPLVGPRLMRTEEAEASSQDERAQRVHAEMLARSMRLTTVVWDQVDPFAVLNNEVVSTGYIFPEGIVVETIEPTRVILRVEDTSIPVNLEEH